METFSALGAICAGNSPVSGEFPAQRPVTRSFDVFFICARINGCVNNGEAGDLSRYRDHYDVTVMYKMDFPPKEPVIQRFHISWCPYREIATSRALGDLIRIDAHMKSSKWLNCCVAAILA